MKVLIIYDREGYAYHRRALALEANHQSWDVACELTQLDPSWPERFSRPDIVFLLDYASAVPVRDRMVQCGWSCPLVVSWNAGPQRRRGMWDRVYEAADFVVCNSQAAYEAWPEYPRRCCISNGVDLDTFKITRPQSERAEKCIWYGRANKEWKGLREVLGPLTKLIAEHGFTFDFRELSAERPAMDTVELVEWYNSGAYVLCASREGYEGTPNLITEAVACGCVAVTTRTGNVLEWGRDEENCLLSARNPVAFLDRLFVARKHRLELAAAGLDALQSWNWAKRAPYFFDLFRAILKRGRDGVPAFSYLDKE